MNYLNHLKQHDNFDKFIVLMDELGYTDEEITTKLEISKQRIYDSRTRLEGLLEALKSIHDAKPISYGNPDVAAIVEAFNTNFGTTKASKWDRFAAKRLSDKHGTETIVKIIEVLAKLSGQQYAPSVNSVKQLEEKWVSVGKFLNRESDNQPINLM